MKKILKLTFVIFFLCSCATNVVQVAAPLTEKNKDPNEILLDHKYFVIAYNKEHHLAKWVKYTLNKSDLNGPGKRPSRFKADPLLQKLKIKAIKHEDYTNTGYARGHLAPAEDFSRSQDAIESTFVMSNVIPQKGSVNSGAWAQLEKKVRTWACGEESITIYTGPIIEQGLSSISSGVLIPNKFFKIIIDNTPPKKVIAVIYNQLEKNQRIERSIVDIQSLVNFVDFDFSNYSTSGPNDLEKWSSCEI